MDGANLFYMREAGWGGTRGQFYIALLSIAAGLFSFFVGQGTGGILLATGIVMIFASRWCKANPLIQLQEDHFDMKAGMIAPRVLVLYKEIAEVVEESPVKAFIRTKGDKKIRLPVWAFEEARRKELCEALRHRAGLS